MPTARGDRTSVWVIDKQMREIVFKTAWVAKKKAQKVDAMS